MTWVLIALGGGVGAVLRLLLDRAARGLHRVPIPLGILTANLVASLGLGLLTALDPAAWATALLGAGVCGGLSTYSSFALGCIEGAARGRVAAAVGYAVLTPVLSIGAAGLGVVIAR